MGRLAHIDDQELFLLIKKSDYEAFDELYNRYWKPLYVTASKKTGCEEDAMDLVQDLFIDFWNKRESTEISSSLSSYLFSSLYYKIFHLFKMKGLQEKHIRNFIEFLPQADQVMTADLASMQEAEEQYEQLQQIINQTIEEMPDKMRQVFQMTRSGEKSIAEIAASLHISPQTVKNQAGSAMQRLRKAVRENALELPLQTLIFLLINS